MAGRVAFLKESSLGRRGGFGLLGAMQWYYAVGSERRGPVETATFNRLVASGTIQPDTLVWRTGMAEWQAWSEVAPLVADVVDAEPGGVSAANTTTTAQTPWPGQTAAAVDASAGLPLEELWTRIRAHGYAMSVGGCLRMGWESLKINYWGALGTTLLFLLMSGAVQQIPFLGFVAAFLVVPQLTGGVWWYFIRRSRGEDATVGDLFAGFGPAFGQLALIAVFQLLVFLPVFAVVAALMFSSISSGSEPGAGAVVLTGLVSLAVFVVVFRWQFAHALVIDRGCSALGALRLSWRMVGLRFWRLLGLMFMLMLVAMLGMLALIVGVFFVMPLFFSAMVQAYEDAIGPTRKG